MQRYIHGIETDITLILNLYFVKSLPVRYLNEFDVTSRPYQTSRDVNYPSIASCHTSPIDSLILR
jgi:hypothetical protein